MLTTQKDEEWAGIQSALLQINDDLIVEGLSQEEQQDSLGSENYLPFFLYVYYNGFLNITSGWVDKLQPISEEVYLKSRPKLIKNGVVASIVGIDELTDGDFANTLCLTIPFYYNAGVIDVYTILIPTTEAATHIISLGATAHQLSKLPTEEFCRRQLNKLMSLTSKAPVVLAFFSPTEPAEIIVEEVSTLKVAAPSIERTIEFAPEYYQASVGLLSYFGEVLRQKDSNTKAKVRIEQDGNRVRLHIESPDGDIEIIDKELTQYALVISRQAEPETLLANRAHIMQLETQLDIARIQVKQAQDLMQLAQGQSTQRINNLEKQVEFLQTQFAAQILQTGQVINLATKQNESHERLQTALLSHSDTLFKDLLKEASGNQQLMEAVGSLHRNLLEGITTIEIEDQLGRALSTIKESKPGFLGRISSQLEGAVSKEAAGSALKWVMQWIEQHQH